MAEPRPIVRESRRRRRDVHDGARKNRRSAATRSLANFSPNNEDLRRLRASCRRPSARGFPHPAKNPAHLRCQDELRITVLEIKIKPRPTDHIPTVVLWCSYHGEGSVSPSASAKLGLQPLALPRHHPACAMPIQSGSRTCGTSFDSCATLRTCRKCKQSPMGCPIWREYVFS